MNLLHLFDLSLVARRDSPALAWQGRTFTFGEIEARSNRVAHALVQRGYRKGDRLGVYLANRVELIDIYLACVKLGVIFVPINILYREREIAHITGRRGAARGDHRRERRGADERLQRPAARAARRR